MGTLLGTKIGISGEESLEKKDDYFFPTYSYRRTYYVLADNTAETESSILGTTGVPALYSAVGGTTICSRRSAKETHRVRHPVTAAATSLWEVDCTFDSQSLDDESSKDPEDRTPKVRWYGEEEEEVLEKDAITGDPVETKWGEPLIITAPQVRPILEVQRYEAPPFDPNINLNYANHVNSAAFYGAPAGTALLLPVEAQEEVVEQTKLISATYRVKFKIKKDGGALKAWAWKAEVLHHGFRFDPGDGGPIRTYTDERGNPATINLDADGKKIADGGAPYYLSFNRFPSANLNDLSLGPF